jgi:hypothetical protein
MGLPIISAIAAHKLAAVLLVASIGISGGAVAATGDGHLSNVVGQISFVIKPNMTNVTQVASLNLGTLVAGQKGTQSSTAIVNFTSSGTYVLQLEGTPLLDQVFAVFNVTVNTPTVVPPPSGSVTSNVILLNLHHRSAPIMVSSAGPESFIVSLVFVVNNDPIIQRGYTVSGAPFLVVGQGPVPLPPPDSTTAHGDGNSQS